LAGQQNEFRLQSLSSNEDFHFSSGFNDNEGSVRQLQPRGNYLCHCRMGLLLRVWAWQSIWGNTLWCTNLHTQVRGNLNAIILINNPRMYALAMATNSESSCPSNEYTFTDLTQFNGWIRDNLAQIEKWSTFEKCIILYLKFIRTVNSQFSGHNLQHDFVHYIKRLTILRDQFFYLLTHF